MKRLAPLFLILGLAGCGGSMAGVSVVAVDLAASYAVQRIKALRADGVNYVSADEKTKRDLRILCREADLLLRNATTVDPATVDTVAIVCDLAREVAE